jgi:hypothetical protein
MTAMATLALGACGRHGDATDSHGAPSSAAAPAPRLPRLKAGYWEEVETLPGLPPHARHFCTSGKPVSLTRLAQGCGDLTVVRGADGRWAVDAACSKGAISTTLHATVGGDFTTAYAGDTTVTMTIQGYPPKRLSSHSQSRYLGACPPAMSADD